MSIPTPPVASFWYPAMDGGSAGADPRGPGMHVLDALRAFREADALMRRRVERDMDMNATDLRALRFLIAAESSERQVTARDLAVYLGISTASTTKLLDRLEGAGHVSRNPHPADRRALLVRITPGARESVRQTLDRMHRRMRDVAQGFSEQEQSAIVRFLEEMTALMVSDD